MKLFLTLMIGLTSLTAFASDELDAIGAPHGLIVREDAKGNRVVFKANVEKAVKSDASAEAALATFVTPENKLAKVDATSELDQTSSNGAWYYGYYYYPTYFSPYYYSYYYSYSYYNYYPSYAYYYGGYNYSYYYYNYGFRF